MSDAWPPWLSSVAGSVQQAADPFLDWLRSSHPASDAPSPSPGYDAAVAGLAGPLAPGSQPPPDLGAIATQARDQAEPPEQSIDGMTPDAAVAALDAQQSTAPGLPPTDAPATPILPPPDSFAVKARAGLLPPESRPPWEPFNAPVGYMPTGKEWMGSPPGTPGRPNPVTFADKAADLTGREDAARMGEQFAADKDPAAADQAQADLTEAYARNPEMRLQAEYDRKAAIDAMQAKAMREQAEKEKADYEESVRIREQARTKALADRAQIEGDAKAMADGTPFGNWWASRSTGQKVANYVAAIFGGLMESSTGGRNSAIDLMMKASDDDANQKWKSLQMRREMNGEDLGDADAEFKFKETMRAAGRQQMINALDAQIANFDPNGKAALDLSNAKAALIAQNAAALDKWQTEAQKQMVDAANADSQRIQANAQLLNAQSLAYQRHYIGGGAGGGGGSGGGKAGATDSYGPKDKHTGDQYITHYNLDPSVFKVKPPDGMTGKEFHDWITLQKDQGNMSAEASREANQRQENDLKRRALAISFNGEDLLDYAPDGTLRRDEFGQPMQLLAPAGPEGEQIRNEVANSVKAVRALYEIKAIRDRMSVGDSKLPWKKAAQQLVSLQADVIKNMKAGTQGMSSDEDMNKIAAAAGVKNVSSFLDQTAAIDQGIRNVINNLNTDLHQHYKYNGPGLDIPNPHAGPPPRATVVDESTARASSRGTGDREENPYSPDFGKRRPTENQQAGIDINAATAERGGTDAPDAVAGLIKAATSGSGIAAREAAAGKFWQLRQSGNKAAVAAFDGMSSDEQARLLAQLPESERWRAIHERLPAEARPPAPPPPAPEPAISDAQDIAATVASQRKMADALEQAGHADLAVEMRRRAADTERILLAPGAR